ncbi:alanine racemase [Anaerotignum lactatifermentans]|uniref:Alanine racemase n=1 Tax=Anaerotignum lactatifermentans TaxID=160404 RepID=A0ABS2G8C4_9FIRM|nr:alanine racemase [Anaerotignum lactatifermentans]MBM6828857.1 alanine racemase [Anaerotignum lactatifermentans]MBM6876970.1 alanine racemase [Anaerotignum lactatifermentans]MBM6950528.1 alanine racemase [Anaerotignum lactatifermentans]
MKIKDLETPAILLDLDIAENNLRTYQALCKENGKKLWPMVKTHKSTALLKKQLEMGAKGALCGTVDECEMATAAGAKKVMYAYPPANTKNIQRLAALAKKTEVIVRLDNLEAAQLLEEVADKEAVTFYYSIIVDMQFHRFGVAADKVVAFAQEMKAYPRLKLYAISTHPGQVYGCTTQEEREAVAKLECETMAKAAADLKAAGFDNFYVTSGSTPTFMLTVADPAIQIYHPGNYIYHDAIQMALGSAQEKDCALTVLATIVSHPSEDVFICDAGAKCLGLDQGAHGNAAVKGFGVVKGHPELTIYGLSEEVGKIKIEGPTDLKIGDKIQIIPNHSCSSANLTSWLIGTRGQEVTNEIEVDYRGNSHKKS